VLLAAAVLVAVALVGSAEMLRAAQEDKAAYQIIGLMECHTLVVAQAVLIHLIPLLFKELLDLLIPVMVEAEQAVLVAETVEQAETVDPE
jgi:hypothetical protein